MIEERIFSYSVREGIDVSEEKVTIGGDSEIVALNSPSSICRRQLANIHGLSELNRDSIPFEQ